MNSSEDFGAGLDLALRRGLENKVSVNTNKWLAAKTRMMSYFVRGYYAMPKMGAYIDAPGLGSITTRGTNCEETFHRCLCKFIKGGQSCAVTVHALIVGFTAKYDMDKVSRLAGKPSGAVVMDFRMNNASRQLSDALDLLMNDFDVAEQHMLNKKNPLIDWSIVEPLEHSKNTFVGALTRTGDSDEIEKNFEDAARKLEATNDYEDGEDDEHVDEFETMCKKVRYISLVVTCTVINIGFSSTNTVQRVVVVVVAFLVA